LSYLGFIHQAIAAYDFLDKPRVLEIGIDQGHSCFPIIHNLVSIFDKFEYVGIDIQINSKITDGLVQMSGVKIRESLECNDFNVSIHQSNSLSLLPKIVESGEKFDIIFVDGDHNYFTVSSELAMIENICHPHTIIICDDYFGRDSLNDSFYSEREEFTSLRQNIENLPVVDEFGNFHIVHNKATPPIYIEPGDFEYQGVRRAIDEFVQDRPGWVIRTYADSDRVVEAVILYQREYISVSDKSRICHKTKEVTHMSIERRNHEDNDQWGFIDD